MANKMLTYPHIYKKGLIYEFKSLDDKSNPRRYTFSSDENSAGLKPIIRHLNNINQITARNWLKLTKLLAYLGLEKDKTNGLSKKPSPWDQLLKDIEKIFHRSSSSKGNDQTKLLEKLEEISHKLPKAENLVTREELSGIIKSFHEELKEVKSMIKSVIG
ncbi:aphid transmission factor [Eupatorium vein clearing virus]|uniref:aphid transmission factor n=1 Tax=Eupatorium vein clearing virus TaxID=515444 RepID=UPI000172CAD5|nr:aphid transmission factor [Eupatorium vein clearing virus]ACB69770.1 aphid transmission factor [Eupatorium vein clearing virus]